MLQLFSSLALFLSCSSSVWLPIAHYIGYVNMPCSWPANPLASERQTHLQSVIA